MTQSKPKKIKKCTWDGQYGKDNAKDLWFWCIYCGRKLPLADLDKLECPHFWKLDKPKKGKIEKELNWITKFRIKFGVFRFPVGFPENKIFITSEDIENFIAKLISTREREEYKNGYNQCLKDRKLTGERWQHLYL